MYGAFDRIRTIMDTELSDMAFMCQINGYAHDKNLKEASLKAYNTACEHFDKLCVIFNYLSGLKSAPHQESLRRALLNELRQKEEFYRRNAQTIECFYALYLMKYRMLKCLLAV